MGGRLIAFLILSLLKIKRNNDKKEKISDHGLADTLKCSTLVALIGINVFYYNKITITKIRIIIITAHYEINRYI